MLEVGFGPGVLLGRLSALTMHVAGVDRSREMIAQARARNANAIERGGVALHSAPAHSLPLKAHTFEKALAVNYEFKLELGRQMMIGNILAK